MHFPDEAHKVFGRLEPSLEGDRSHMLGIRDIPAWQRGRVGEEKAERESCCVVLRMIRRGGRDGRWMCWRSIWANM